MRTGSIAALAVVTVLAAASPASAHAGGQAARSCRLTWTLVSTPHIPGSQGPDSGASAQIDSVSILPGGDPWFSAEVDGPSLQPWVLRWDEGAIRTAKQIPQSTLDLQGGGPGSFGSATDGWVLAANEGAAPSGMGGQGDDLEPPYAEHWYDGRWTMTPLAVPPNPRNTGTQLLDVATTSATDAWAVGLFYEAKPGVTAGSVPTGALIEHWDGTSWHIVANPDSARADGQLNALTLVSRTDIWAVGRVRNSGGMIVPLVLHWDGRSWRSIPAPAASAPSAFNAISAAGGSDVWAVGAQTKPGTGNVAIPLAEHWDGRSWIVARLPGVGNAVLWGVYAVSSTDVWATVEETSGKPAIFLHESGRSWQAVPAPGHQEYGLYYAYTGIDGTGPGDIWAVGSVTSQSTGESNPVVAHLSCG
jgi:hypothetical protein